MTPLIFKLLRCSILTIAPVFVKWPGSHGIEFSSKLLFCLPGPARIGAWQLFLFIHWAISLFTLKPFRFGTAPLSPLLGQDITTFVYWELPAFLQALTSVAGVDCLDLRWYLMHYWFVVLPILGLSQEWKAVMLQCSFPVIFFLFLLLVSNSQRPEVGVNLAAIAKLSVRL